MRVCDKRILGIFSLRICTLGPDLQRIISVTYELLMISGTYEKLKTTAEVSLENHTLER